MKRLIQLLAGVFVLEFFVIVATVSMAHAAARFLCAYGTDGDGLWSRLESQHLVRTDVEGDLFVLGTDNDPDLWFTSLVRLDSDGESVWETDVESGHYKDLSLNLAGSIFVVGAFEEENKAGSFAVDAYDPGGLSLWQNREVEGIGRNVVLDHQGNVIAVGYQGTGWFITNKYSNEGSLLWSVPHSTYIGLAECPGLGLYVDQKDNVYVSNKDASGRSLTVKYDPEGQLLWEDRMDDFDYGQGWKIVGDPTGGVFVVSSCEADTCLAKYSEDGEAKVVVADCGDSLGLIPPHLSIDADGNPVVACTKRSKNGGDPWGYTLVIKYDNDLNEMWTARFDDPEEKEIEAKDVIVDRYGNVYLMAQICTKLDWEFSCAGEWYFLTIKYNAEGEKLWAIDQSVAKNMSDNAAQEDGTIYALFYPHSGYPADYTGGFALSPNLWPGATDDDTSDDDDDTSDDDDQSSDDDDSDSAGCGC